MQVIAKQIGEYPLGRWRQPGERFEFHGKKPAMWMAHADEIEKETNAEKLRRAKVNYENAKSSYESAKAVYEALGGNKEEPKKESKGIHAHHKGFGKWDVIGADGEVVDGGSDLNKADAGALVESLLGESSGA